VKRVRAFKRQSKRRKVPHAILHAACSRYIHQSHVKRYRPRISRPGMEAPANLRCMGQLTVSSAGAVLSNVRAVHWLFTLAHTTYIDMPQSVLHDSAVAVWRSRLTNCSDGPDACQACWDLSSTRARGDQLLRCRVTFQECQVCQPKGICTLAGTCPEDAMTRIRMTARHRARNTVRHSI
jgi:hypothetical protein